MPWGNDPLFRAFYGWIIPHSPIVLRYLSHAKSDVDSVYIKQNALIPMQHVEAFVDLCQDEINLHPIWLAPCNAPHSARVITTAASAGGTNTVGIHFC